MQTQNVTDTSNKTNAIERALAAAKARRAAKAAQDTGDVEKVEDGLPKGTIKAQRPTEEDRVAAKTKREAERTARAAERAEKLAALLAAKEKRAAERAEKKAAVVKEGRQPAHMKKVDRARAKLPQLAAAAEETFAQVTSSMDIAQIEALAQHLLVQARAMRTTRALQTAPIPLGSAVTIVGGDPKFIGSAGKVVHSQKLRLKVQVEGVKNPVYLYAGEAELLGADVAAA